MPVVQNDPRQKDNKALNDAEKYGVISAKESQALKSLSGRTYEDAIASVKKQTSAAKQANELLRVAKHYRSIPKEQIDLIESIEDPITQLDKLNERSIDSLNQAAQEASVLAETMLRTGVIPSERAKDLLSNPDPISRLETLNKEVKQKRFEMMQILRVNKFVKPEEAKVLGERNDYMFFTEARKFFQTGTEIQQMFGAGMISKLEANSLFNVDINERSDKVRDERRKIDSENQKISNVVSKLGESGELSPFAVELIGSIRDPDDAEDTLNELGHPLEKSPDFSLLKFPKLEIVKPANTDDSMKIPGIHQRPTWGKDDQPVIAERRAVNQYLRTALANLRGGFNHLRKDIQGMILQKRMNDMELKLGERAEQRSQRMLMGIMGSFIGDKRPTAEDIPKVSGAAQTIEAAKMNFETSPLQSRSKSYPSQYRKN